MIAPPDYDSMERAAWLANAEQLRGNINHASVTKKIRSWADKNSLEYEFVRYKVLTDDTFSLHFAVVPGRQSLHQKVAAQHISSRVPLVEDFKTLPAGGKGAEYLVSGMVVPNEVRAKLSTEGKSIDFHWSLTRLGRTLKVYATHKFTREEGGSQDNQHADIRQFLAAAVRANDEGVLFFAICDGPYYLRPSGASSRKTRLDELQANFNRNRVRVCNVATLPAAYAEAVREWAKSVGVYLYPGDDLSLAEMLSS